MLIIATPISCFVKFLHEKFLFTVSYKNFIYYLENLLETQQERRIAVLSFSDSVTARDKTEEEPNLLLPYQILKILGTVEEFLSSSGKWTWSMLLEIVPN